MSPETRARETAAVWAFRVFQETDLSIFESACGCVHSAARDMKGHWLRGFGSVGGVCNVPGLSVVLAIRALTGHTCIY